MHTLHCVVCSEDDGLSFHEKGGCSLSSLKSMLIFSCYINPIFILNFQDPFYDLLLNIQPTYVWDGSVVLILIYTSPILKDGQCFATFHSSGTFTFSSIKFNFFQMGISSLSMFSVSILRGILPKPSLFLNFILIKQFNMLSLSIKLLLSAVTSLLLL
jgi:hypothetical protein